MIRDPNLAYVPHIIVQICPGTSTCLSIPFCMPALLWMQSWAVLLQAWFWQRSLSFGFPSLCMTNFMARTFWRPSPRTPAHTNDIPPQSPKTGIWRECSPKVLFSSVTNAQSSTNLAGFQMTWKETRNKSNPICSAETELLYQCNSMDM